MTDPLIGATTASFAVTLSVALTEPVDVAWSTKDGTAKAGIDYEAASGVVTFLPGETEKQIQVTVYGQDVGATQPKNFYIKLTPPTNAVLGTSLIECIITVEDDEGTPITSIVVAQGKRGLKGDPGLSAYEQAVLMGYEGTVEEWMESTADAAQAATRAEEALIEVEANAARAEAAAAAAAFAGRIYPTPAAGVDPVTGVTSGSYYNVRSPSDDNFIDEYQNVGGVATPTGKSYPSSSSLSDIRTSKIGSFASIAEMNAYTGMIDGQVFFVKSYYAPNYALSSPYVGGGERVYKSSLSAVNNGGTIINGWVLINPKWTLEEWGAKGNDPLFDDSVPIQNAFDFVQQHTNANLYSEQEGVTFYLHNPLILTGTEAYIPNGNMLNIDFSGVKLAPAVDNLTMLVVNRNHTKISRLFITNPLSKVNVTGVLFGSLTPEIKGGTCFSTLEYPTWEYIKTAFKAQPTRTVNGSTAGAYYNEIVSPVVMHTDVGFQFTGNDLALENQNTRYNIFNPRQIGGDYMFKLECVETLRVFGGSAEFVGNNTGTGAVIYQTQKYPNHMIENNGNTFYGLVAEACNRLYDNNSWTLGLINVSNINPLKPNISGSVGRVITEISGSVRVTSDIASNEPILSVHSEVHNKQLYLRITETGDCQIWGDTVINIPQNIEMFEKFLNCGVLTANQRIFTPNVTSKTSDLVLTSNNGDFGALIVNTTANYAMLYNSSGKDTVFGGSPVVRPDNDGQTGLGSASKRWGAVYSSTGTIQTSDERLKQDFRSLNDAEKSAAIEIKNNIGLFRFIDAVKEKGDSARKHVGVLAQQVISILEKHGLDWHEYGFICYDEWDATEDVEIVDGEKTVVVKGVEAGNRYSIRYDELTMFILAAL